MEKQEKNMWISSLIYVMSYVNIFLYLQIMPDSSVDREELLDMVSKLLQYSHKGTINL